MKNDVGDDFRELIWTTATRQAWLLEYIHHIRLNRTTSSNMFGFCLVGFSYVPDSKRMFEDKLEHVLQDI